MMLRIQDSLARRRRGQLAGAGDGGFTLIELLVVVLIIGILAAIAIPVYLGLQKTSKNASVQTDLANAKIAIMNVQASTGTWPVSAANVATVVANKDGYTRGASTGTIKYTKRTGSPYNFCLSSTAVNGDGTKYFVTDATGVRKVSATAPIVALPTGC